MNDWCLSSAIKPEQIGVDLPDYYAVKSKTSDLEIIHTYTLYNKGPSDATRTEIKLFWPILPLAAFQESTPLLYGIDLPSIIRVSDPKATGDRCYIYQPVGEYLLFLLIILQDSIDLDHWTDSETSERRNLFSLYGSNAFNSLE